MILLGNDIYIYVPIYNNIMCDKTTNSYCDIQVRYGSVYIINLYYSI